MTPLQASAAHKPPTEQQTSADASNAKTRETGYATCTFHNPLGVEAVTTNVRRASLLRTSFVKRPFRKSVSFSSTC